MEKEAMRLWEEYGCDAEWDAYDPVDDYCWACSIFLEIDGFVFSGEGYKTCGEKEVDFVECTCPDGTVVKVE